MIRTVLEDRIGSVWVEGEISNFTRHSSGHTYFTLKDKTAQLRCVIWRGAGVRFPCEDPTGLKFITHGCVTVYERGGQYQLTVDQVKPLGVGELQLVLERLKKKLMEEGLFDESHKQPLPGFPRCVAVVTSPTGAAVRDMISVISRRYPYTRIVLAPVTVQGEGASGEIADALDYLNRWGEPDVIIAGRGGGSLEDLWAFNEEATARAIFRSRIPVVSAVGHEIDFTIADFVADLRAPTPSAAAELVVPDRTALSGRIQALSRSLRSNAGRHLSRNTQMLVRFSSSYGLRKIESRLREMMQYMDTLGRRMATRCENGIIKTRSELSELSGKLDVLSPFHTMRRGYSITRILTTGDIVRDASAVSPDSRVSVTLFRGSLVCLVEEVEVRGGRSHEE